MSEGARASILGLGTARPPFIAKQEELSAAYLGAMSNSGADRSTLRRLKHLFRRAAVRSRHFCIPDFADPLRAELYSGGRFPSTAERMRAYQRLAPALAESAARRALERSGTASSDISHLVIATCTGVGAPDLDVEIATRLSLPATVERTMVVWMSCTGAFPALRAARRAVEGRRGARALVVSVELCSLHARFDPDPESLVAHALFSDGAAAAIVGPGGDGAREVASIGSGLTKLFVEGRDRLRWEFAEDGFRAHVDLSLPELIEARVAGFVRQLLGEQASAVDSWCVHPGGSAILDGVQRALELGDEALESSRHVLATMGNMSSATILYVLERELARMRPGQAGVMLGFGTGLTMEGLVFRRGETPVAELDQEGSNSQ